MNVDTVQAFGRVIATFGFQHLSTCILFRDKLESIEKENLGNEFGSFFETVRAYGSAGIMSAAAALEALINELFIDPHENLRPLFSDFEKEFWKKGGVERKPILKKYNLALSMLGAQTIDTNDSIYVETDALIELRNALVHFKLIWDPKRKRHIALETMVAGKFQLSPFPDSGADFVTMKAMSSSCLRWSISTIGQFIEEFQKRAGLNQKKMGRFLEQTKK